VRESCPFVSSQQRTQKKIRAHISRDYKILIKLFALKKKFMRKIKLKKKKMKKTITKQPATKSLIDIFDMKNKID
jgi:hypothetical protein